MDISAEKKGTSGSARFLCQKGTNETALFATSQKTTVFTTQARVYGTLIVLCQPLQCLHDIYIILSK